MNTTSELGFKIPSLARLGASEPAQLYFRGEPALLQKRRISIVGSRKMSVYSKNLILRLAREPPVILHLGSGLCRTLPCGPAALGDLSLLKASLP